MSAVRPLCLALLATMAVIPGARAQQPGDTARYVVLFSGRPAGSYTEWRSNGEIHSVYDYNDRGRGPHQVAVMRVGADGVPTSLTVVGPGYLKDTGDEKFTNASGTATWGSALGGFVAPAVLGNIIGGVIFVAMLNHGQVSTARG